MLDPAVVDHLMQTERGRATLLADALARFGHADAATPAPTPAEPAPPPEDDGPYAVVWRESRDVWKTSFPPPPDFDGDEEFDYGDPDDNRTPTLDEQQAAERFESADPARIAHAAARDAWFAGGDAPAPIERDADAAIDPRHPVIPDLTGDPGWQAPGLASPDFRSGPE